jgi:alkanesulfonate monooxygenase SsuD/methylene tetrahydromethanopterin reductase-like flavin-dependent oxidoreductase (luciferase family)
MVDLTLFWPRKAVHDISLEDEMHFGLFCLNNQRQKDLPASQIYGDMIAQVKLAEQVGFEIAWVAEHHFSNYCLCPSPLTMCAYLSGVTKTIKLGPAVIVAPLYEPVRLLEEIGFVDQLSNGRLILGFGSGYQDYEFNKFGVPLSEARSRLLEVLDLVDLYLNNESVKYAGTRVNLPETFFSVKTSQKRPPIYLAGLADDAEMHRRARERNYVPFFTTGWSSLEAMSEMRQKADRNWSKAGGSPCQMGFALQRYVFITDNEEDALKAADGARYVRRVGMAMRNKYGVLDGAFLQEIPAPDEPPLEQLVERMLVGSIDKVSKQLALEITTLGLTHVSCFMAIPGLPQEKILSSIEAFGTSVIPKVQAIIGPLAAHPASVTAASPA